MTNGNQAEHEEGSPEMGQVMHVSDSKISHVAEQEEGNPEMVQAIEPL